MLGYLAVATVVLGAVATVNLVLTMGVIRRLRQVVPMGIPPGEDLLPKAGDQVGAFSVRTADGTELSHTNLSGSGIAVFLSPGCEPCERLMPSLTARLHPADAGRTLVVIAGTPAETAEYVRRLRGLATVVREETAGGPVQTAFGVVAFPTVVTVGGRTITWAGSRLPEPAAAAPATRE